MPTDIVYAHLIASDTIAIVMKMSIGRCFTEMYNENDIKLNKIKNYVYSILHEIK